MNTTTPQLALWSEIPQDPKEYKHQQRQQAKQARTIESKLAAIRALHDELNNLLYSGEKPTINSPSDAAALVKYEMSILEQEELWVLLLNTRNKVKQIVKVYKGSVNSSQVRVAEVFREAIRQNATAIIIAHNHPSNDPTPSPDDVAVTRTFVQAGKLLDVEVLDHLVIGQPGYASLKERGLGFS